MLDWKGATALLVSTGCAALVGIVATAQVPPVPVARFSAETANLTAGPASVRIDILAWSTEADRGQFADAWNGILPVQAGARGGGAAPADGRGRGAPRGAPVGPVDPSAGAPAAPARGRGAPGRRGGPPGGAIGAPAAVPNTPAGVLAAALQSAPGVGYLWSSESVGYSLRYAYRMTQPDGGVRIVLATDRRLGGSDAWRPAGGVPNEYAFSVIELRLNAAMTGEGKTSLTGTVFLDPAANTIALEDYDRLPVVLAQVAPAVAY